MGLSNISSVIFLVAITFFVFAESVSGAHVLDVYRMIQYDRSGSSYGSRNSYLNAKGTTVLSATPVEETTTNTSKIINIERRVFLLRILEIDAEILDSLVTRKDVLGLLILVPTDFTALWENAKKIQALESHLAELSLGFPVYFAFENSDLESIYSTIAKSSVAGDQFQFSVLDKEAAAVAPFRVKVYQGTVKGSNSANGESAVPTIAFVAHYDTLGLVPGMTRGVDSNGSGAVALLELMRIFSKLYARGQSSYNLLFILSGAGRLNYAGTRYWLQQTDVQLLDSVRFAICLESIAGDSLYLHVAKKPKDEKMQALFEAFKQTASDMSIPFDIVVKKINASHPENAWEHEVFAYKQVTGGTFSSLPAASPLQLTRSSLADQPNPNALKNIERNTLFIAEAVASFIYPASANLRTEGSSSNYLIGPKGINSKFVQAVLDALSSQVRGTPYMKKDSPLFPAFDKVFKDYADEQSVMDFDFSSVSSEWKFFGNIQSKMTVFKVKSIVFDIVLFFPIVGYLLGLFIYFKGLAGLSEIKNALIPKSKSSKKSK